MGYDYTESGFDKFMSRSIDNLSQANLDSAGPVTTAQAYDRSQISGSLGDSLQLGNIVIDGRGGGIGLNQGRNQPLWIGTDSKGNQAVKIAKDGLDGRTARDDQLNFNSLQDSLKVIKTGTETVAGSQPTNWATVPHNLGFAPVPLVFLNNVNLSGIANGANIPLPTWSSLSVDTVNQQVVMRTWLHALADITNLYVVLFNSTGSNVSLNFTYYLLQESAKTT